MSRLLPPPCGHPASRDCAHRAVTQRPGYCACRAGSQRFGSCAGAVSQRAGYCAHRAVAGPGSDTSARAIRHVGTAGVGAAPTRTGGAVSQPVRGSASRASTRPDADAIVCTICRRRDTIVEGLSPGSGVHVSAGSGAVGAAASGSGYAPAGGGAGGSAWTGTLSHALRGGPTLRAACHLAPARC